MAPRYDRRRFVRHAVAATVATPAILSAPAAAQEATQSTSAPVTFEFLGMIYRDRDETATSMHINVVDGVATLKDRSSDQMRPVTLDPAFVAELFRLTRRD